MKILLITAAFFFAGVNFLYTQEVPDFIKERKSYQRELWFYEQRIFPYETFPEGAIEKAYYEKISLINRFGFFSNSSNWFSLGPSPGINQNYGYVSSRVASIKFHPSNPDIIYIAAACGGVWKTTNNGISWMPKSDFEISLSSGAIAIDNSNPEIIYYGTGEATYFTYSYYGRGLLKSTNGGYNWTLYRNGLPESTYFSRIVIKPGNQNILFAALGTGGLYKSTDAGQNWFQILSGRCDDIIFSPDGTRAYLVGSGTGYRISTNGGESFSTYSSFPMGTRAHITVCKNSPNVLYSTVYKDTTVYVYKSTNSGVNYVTLPNTFTGTTQAWYDYYIYVNPNDVNNVFIGLVDLWRTTNGRDFVKITNTSAGPVHVDHHNLDFHPSDPNTIVIATDGGIYLSTNRGTNWSNINSNLSLTQFYRAASDPVNSSHIIGGTQDNGVQRTTGDLRWNVVYGGDGGEVCFNPKDSRFILTENQFNAVRRSTDSGITWNNAVTGITGTGAWIAPIIAHPDSNGIFYTARQQVFKTTNNAQSWVQHSTGISGTVRELAISKSNPSVLIATVNNLIYKSTDGGKTFLNIQNNLPSRIITGICIHPDSSNVYLASLSGFGTGHIFKSLNGGVNWTDISSNLPDAPANDIMFYYPGFKTGTYITATDVGVYISSNFGSNWVELAEGLPNTVCINLDYNQPGNKLRVATHGRGIWEYNGIIPSVNLISPEVPTDTELEQNYPNPFNQSTIINFKCRISGNYKIEIFDSLGRIISIPLNQDLNPGTYRLYFNASAFTSGIYFYTLSLNGGFINSKIMILTK